MKKNSLLRLVAFMLLGGLGLFLVAGCAPVSLVIVEDVVNEVQVPEPGYVTTLSWKERLPEKYFGEQVVVNVTEMVNVEKKTRSVRYLFLVQVSDITPFQKIIFHYSDEVKNNVSYKNENTAKGMVDYMGPPYKVEAYDWQGRQTLSARVEGVYFKDDLSGVIKVWEEHHDIDNPGHASYKATSRFDFNGEKVGEVGQYGKKKEELLFFWPVEIYHENNMYREYNSDMGNKLPIPSDWDVISSQTKFIDEPTEGKSSFVTTVKMTKVQNGEVLFSMRQFVDGASQFNTFYFFDEELALLGVPSYVEVAEDMTQTAYLRIDEDHEQSMHVTDEGLVRGYITMDEVHGNIAEDNRWTPSRSLVTSYIFSIRETEGSVGARGSYTNVLTVDGHFVVWTPAEDEALIKDWPIWTN